MTEYWDGGIGGTAEAVPFQSTRQKLVVFAVPLAVGALEVFYAGGSGRKGIPGVKTPIPIQAIVAGDEIPGLPSRKAIAGD